MWHTQTHSLMKLSQSTISSDGSGGGGGSLTAAAAVEER